MKPIIVLTAFGNEHKKKALEAGANAILTKPIDFDLLTDLLKQYVK
jgi:CheY-like chemotaxis protein